MKIDTRVMKLGGETHILIIIINFLIGEDELICHLNIAILSCMDLNFYSLCNFYSE